MVQSLNFIHCLVRESEDFVKPQSLKILSHLWHGKTITPLEALRDYGCARLAARIRELRAAGWDIATEYETNNGKRYARYRLGRKAA